MAPPQIIALLVLGLVCVVVLMGGLNAHFISKLVKKIDKVDDVSGNVALMQHDIKMIESKMAAFADIYQRLVILEKQVAVFEYVFKNQSGPKA